MKKKILLIEDNPADQTLFSLAIARSERAETPIVINDGEIALSYLRREGEYCDSQRPDVVVLDLNLPKMDGREVLRAIKSDPDLKSIPVIVLTSSRSEEEILQCYLAGANSYLVKGSNLQENRRLMEGFEAFWLTIAQLPSR